MVSKPVICQILPCGGFSQIASQMWNVTSRRFLNVALKYNRSHLKYAEDPYDCAMLGLPYVEAWGHFSPG